MSIRVAVALAALTGALAAPESVVAQRAYGHKFNYKSARPVLEVTSNHTLTIAVQDQRPYVLTGDKPETFVGLMRAAVGIPYDVHTVSGQSLSSDLAFALAQAFSFREVRVGTVNVEASSSKQDVVAALLKPGTSRILLVTISEWKTDTYVVTSSTKVLYHLFAELLDENGKAIAHKGLRGEDSSASVPSDTMAIMLAGLLRGPISDALQEGSAPAIAKPSSSLLMQQVQCKIGDAVPQSMTRLACSQEGGSVQP